jgi:hypothetical protein
VTYGGFGCLLVAFNSFAHFLVAFVVWLLKVSSYKQKKTKINGE